MCNSTGCLYRIVTTATRVYTSESTTSGVGSLAQTHRRSKRRSTRTVPPPRSPRITRLCSCAPWRRELGLVGGNSRSRLVAR
jgi:hypothetical protein